MTLRPLALALASGLGAVLLSTSVVGQRAAPPAPPPAPPMVLGVDTHFDQRWPISLLGRAKALGVRAIHDDLPWSKGEVRPGQYTFNSFDTGFIGDACHAGFDVLLMVDPRNPNYDGGATAHTSVAQAAYAHFLDALLTRFDGCIIGVEIGNEINSNGLTLPDGVDHATAYAGLLKATYSYVKAKHPKVALLGGSTNAIGTGFLETLFAQDALANLDAVVVHPYRNTPEGVSLELGELKRAMRRHGPERPIWATEFGNATGFPATLPAFFLKLFAQLNNSNVPRAYWYALMNESYYANVGLYDDHERPTPAGTALRFAVGELLPRGRPARLDAGDLRTELYRFGDAYVIWGAPRLIRFAGAAQYRDALGHVIAPLMMVSDDPVVVTGATGYTLGKSDVVADSLLEFGTPPWTYFSMNKQGIVRPLHLLPQNYTMAFTDPLLRPLEIHNDSLIPAGDGSNPARAVLRWTAPAAASLRVLGCFRKTLKGDGVDLQVFHNGRPVHAQIIANHATLDGLTLAVAKGDHLDFAFGPNQNASDDATSVRVRLVQAGSAADLPCQ